MNTHGQRTDSAGVLLVAVMASAFAWQTPAHGQLADCTITFDATCPTAAPLCGALFGGGDSCVIDFITFCYDTGLSSYRVNAGQTGTITLNDDLNKLSVFFSGLDGSSGEMRFFDIGGVEVEPALITNDDCRPVMPDRVVLAFSTPVRSIEVTSSGGRVYIDTFRTNPIICGDGFLDAGEECDDGNTAAGDGCSATCTLETCGDGVVNGSEECDDMNGVNGDGCDNNCTFTACGNGIVTAPEECDDGNLVAGDGCDGSCLIESPPDCVCGDFDENGGINLADFSSFAVCFNQPVAANPECTCMDLDGSGAINLQDFATFAGIFGSTSTSVPPDCSP